MEAWLPYGVKALDCILQLDNQVSHSCLLIIIINFNTNGFIAELWIIFGVDSCYLIPFMCPQLHQTHSCFLV